MIWLFIAWENRRIARGGEPLVDPAILRTQVLRGGPDLVLLPVPAPGRALLRDPALPLGRPRALRDRHRGADAAALDHPAPRGGRDPQSLPQRLAAPRRPARVPGAVRRPRRPDRRPRRRRRRRASRPGRCCWPGSASARLASQLGSVTVSSVPDEQSGEVGGLQNTVTNLGVSIGTALAGAILIAALSSSFLTGVEKTPPCPTESQAQAHDQARRRGPLRLRQANSKPRSRSPRLSTGRPTRSSGAALADDVHRGRGAGDRRRRDRLHRRGHRRHHRQAHAQNFITKLKLQSST